MWPSAVFGSVISSSKSTIASLVVSIVIEHRDTIDERDQSVHLEVVRRTDSNPNGHSVAVDRQISPGRGPPESPSSRLRQ